MSKNLKDKHLLIVAWLASDTATLLVVGLPYDKLTWAAFSFSALFSAVFIFLAYRGVYWAALICFVFFAVGCIEPLIEIFKTDLLKDKIFRAIEFAMVIWAAAICRRILREISLAAKGPGATDAATN